MITRQTLLDTINYMLATTLNQEGYYHNPDLELTSDQGIHKIYSEIQLLCGHRLNVEVFYEDGNVGSAVRVGEDVRFSNADLSEMAKVAGIIERGLNTTALVDVFEKYKP